jgi:hypothetical protein
MAPFRIVYPFRIIQYGAGTEKTWVLHCGMAGVIEGITIGGRKLIYSASFLVADKVDALVDVPNPHGPMPFTLRFGPTETGQQTAHWRTENGRLVVEFKGWTGGLGNLLRGPVRIGELDGEPLGFQAISYALDGINHVHFYLYQGGVYE